MKVQDFFSIVQLGVGIHAGTAILQLSGELGVAPVERRIEAMEMWLRQEKDRGFNLEDIADDLAILRNDLIVFKAQYDNLYRQSIIGTTACGILLVAILMVMSFVADMDMEGVVGIVIVCLSVFPAAMFFSRLWSRSSEALRPIKSKMRKLESKVKSPDPISDI